MTLRSKRQARPRRGRTVRTVRMGENVKGWAEDGWEQAGMQEYAEIRRNTQEIRRQK